MGEFFKTKFDEGRSFYFLMGYLVEFVLALFVYQPIAVTIIFSGVLGFNGRVPILGGRPREMQRERLYEMSQRDPKLIESDLTLSLGGFSMDDMPVDYTSASASAS